MALTPSNMRALGTRIPKFSLRDVITEKMVTVEPDQVDRPCLVMFLCCHCPYVVHLEGSLAGLGNDYLAKGVNIWAICSNDQNTYPQDAPDRMREQAARLKWPFPYLHDETQEVAKAFEAACTPDFFLFDARGKLVYRGQYDGSRPGNGIGVTGSDLRRALNQVLRGEEVFLDQKPSLGCNIKWRQDS
jgi:peroxiredoxin